MINAKTDIKSPRTLSRPERWALLALFLLVLLPRLVYPVSRPLQWHDRSIIFVEALAKGDFASTLYSEHPGVTVMWLSGLGQWGYYGLRTVLGQHPIHPTETAGRAYTGQIAAALFPLAVMMAVGLVWGWHLLARLWGKRLAWTAALLWALDPFFLANSKVVHLDALLGTTMMLSALYMLLHLRQRDRRSLVFSAVLGGLALLTKTVALFLIPFWGLCLLVTQVEQAAAVWLARRERADRRLYRISTAPLGMGWRSVWASARPLIVWLGVALAVWLVLWPAMWVRPGDVLDLLYQRGFVRHAVGGRPMPLWYRGQVIVGDPGIGFYLDGVLFRSTLISLPFAFVGLLAAARRSLSSVRRRCAVDAGPRNVFLMAAFVFFFFAQMSLGSGKDVRYLLPAFLAIDVLAAMGLLWWAEGLTSLPVLKWLGSAGIVAGLLLLQAFLVLPRFPYFGLHYNSLMGGAQAAQRVFPLADFGEGLDKAGRYLDSQPDIGSQRISTQYLANEMLALYVRADIYDVAEVGDDAHWLVFGTQYNARSTNFPRWGQVWDACKFVQPEKVFYFDGLAYVWIYRGNAWSIPPNADAQDLPHPLGARLGDAIRLLGYRLTPDKPAPGDSLLLTLYWESSDVVAGDYTVFTHLIGPDGQLVAQKDNPPVRGAHPTSIWPIGVRIDDPFELTLPADAPLGEYTLSVGMYEPLSGERLPARSADGILLLDNRVELQTITLEPPVPFWRRALALAWLLMIGLGLVVRVVKDN